MTKIYYQTDADKKYLESRKVAVIGYGSQERDNPGTWRTAASMLS